MKHAWTKLPILVGVVALLDTVAIAQVVTDPSLGVESSIITTAPNNGGAIHTVTGGAIRGTNLFHSFDQFSLMANDAAVFSDLDGIDTIIGRVTGATQSTLDGLIQANISLFLVNPAGIVFGPNARLDIGGSFLASTGTGLRFENGFVYDTRVAEVPPLLTVSAPVGLSIGAAAGDLTLVNNRIGLSVRPGQTMALIGGDISVVGSQLSAPGGHIEIVSIDQTSELALTPIAQGLNISLDDAIGYGNIQISGQSVIDTSGTGGGAIELQGQKITLREQSALISDTLGDLDGRGVQIVAGRVSLLDSSYIGAATLGSGAGSSIDITATDIELLGTAIANYKLLELATFVGTRQITDRQIGGITTATVAAGRTGDISLNTQRLVLDEGVQVSTESFGPGDSGDIDIDATESIRLTGSGILAGSRVSGVPLLTPEAIATGLSTSGIPAGSGGSIDINTTRLAIENGSAIVTGTISDQDAGNVSINATESIVLRGSFAPFVFPTTITTVSIGGRGAAGDLDIKTGRLSIQDGSIIFADSGVRTLMGNIEFGGLAGDVTIVATESVDITGGQPIVAVFGPSAVRSRTFSDATAGTITITTPTLNVRDGGRITSATLNDGTGGAINIDAQTVFVSGEGKDEPNAISGIFANSGIETRVNFLTGEDLSAPASGTGGSITINASDLTVQDTAEITVGSFDSGAAGNLDITADTVRLNNGGKLTATTTSDGGGNIELITNSVTLDNSSITASAESGDGGNLSFNFQDILLLRNGSLISTEAGTAAAAGDGGSITFDGGIVLAVPDENSDIIANAFAGQGGRIVLAARDILGLTTSSGLTTAELRTNRINDISASSEFGVPGEIQILGQFTDPDQGLSELPTTPLGVERLIGQAVCAAGEVSNFIVTGRGGVPLSPQDVLGNIVVWFDEQDNWVQELTALPDQSWEIQPPDVDFEQVSSPPLVEAQGVSRFPDGSVALVAPEITAQERTETLTCQAVGEQVANE